MVACLYGSALAVFHDFLEKWQPLTEMEAAMKLMAFVVAVVFVYKEDMMVIKAV